jgi:hypothetical protein
VEKQERQFEILYQVLQGLHSSGFLKELILIGSWCLYFYRLHFQSEADLPAVRTLDVDFLIPRQKAIEGEGKSDAPTLLKHLGFVPTFNRATGMVVYDHPELRVEFLIPAKGKGNKRPVKIEGLNITAQPLRFLNMLTEDLLVVPYEGMKVKVPHPVAYGFHKLLISPRRLKKEKASKDYLTAVELLRFLRKKGEGRKILSYFRSLPNSWKEMIRSTLESGKAAEILEEIKEIK